MGDYGGQLVLLLVWDCNAKEKHTDPVLCVCVCVVFFGRNLEKEISFDFGPSAEFAYLYSQCYDLNTSEYVHTSTLKHVMHLTEVLTFKLFFFPPGMSTSFVRSTEYRRNPSLVDRKLTWGE